MAAFIGKLIYMVPLPCFPGFPFWWWCYNVGWGENEISNGHAVESDRRWNNGSTAMGVLGKR